MKLKEGFVLRDVAGQTIVLPSGDDLNLNMMVTLNETGKFLWELCQAEFSEEDLVSALLKEYNVDEKRACSAVSAFVEKLKEHDFLAY